MQEFHFFCYICMNKQLLIMNKRHMFFAVDLGATSGRTIVGTIENGKLVQQELTRFPNHIIETGGHCYWDIFALYREVTEGLRIAAQRKMDICSIGIDTWGVDFVCIGSDGALLRNPVAYRDPHTMGKMEEYFNSVIDKKTVYDKTGIQFMNFNSLFQLYAMQQNSNSALRNAESILFVPDALIYMLTGQKICEYTIASTSQLLNPSTKELDEELLQSVGLNRKQFGRMVMPGTTVGCLSEEVCQITGMKAVPVVAVAGHDTASAVAAVPAKNEKFAYLSSGTWSLMGLELPHPVITDRSYELNFTNEGGIEGTTRFLKNICGMWIYEQCRREWLAQCSTEEEKERLSHTVLQAEADKEEPMRSIINPDDAAFANPSSMTRAIADYCKAGNQPVPQTHAQYCRCIFDSLALRYKQVFTWMQEFAPFKIDTLHIIGGGSRNRYLNQLSADTLGINIIAGPQECTAIGNIMLQAKACGLVNDIWQMREVIANSVELEKFCPNNNIKH